MEKIKDLSKQNKGEGLNQVRSISSIITQQVEANFQLQIKEKKEQVQMDKPSGQLQATASKI